MPTDEREKTHEECKAYVAYLRQRLTGRPVRIHELQDLFDGLQRRILAAYRDGLIEAQFNEYTEWSDEDLIAGSVYLAEVARRLGLQRRGWVGAELLRDYPCFAVDFDLEDLVVLYLQKGCTLDSVIEFIEVTLSRAAAGVALVDRLASFPLGQEVGLAVLDCLGKGDNQSLRRFKRALKVDRLRGRHPNRLEAEEEGKDAQAVAMMRAWQVYATSRARAYGSPLGAARVPPVFEGQGLEDSWKVLAERLSPLVRVAQGWLLPILRGEAEKYRRQAYQAIRDYWWKRAAQKRGGHGPLEIPTDPECPFCHRGTGKPARSLNPDPRVGRPWPFLCDRPPCKRDQCRRRICLHGRCGRCGVGFDGRPDPPYQTISWGDLVRQLRPAQPNALDTLLAKESQSPPHFFGTWEDTLTISRIDPEPDAEPAVEQPLESDEIGDPEPSTWPKVSLDDRIQEVYQVAEQLYGKRGSRLLDAYLKHENAVGASKALGFSRKTCHVWFRQIRAGVLAAHA